MLGLKCSTFLRIPEIWQSRETEDCPLTVQRYSFRLHQLEVWKHSGMRLCGCVATSRESNDRRSSVVVLQFGDNPLVPLWCSTRGWSWTPWFDRRQSSCLWPSLESRYKLSRPEWDVTAVEPQQGSSSLLKSGWRLPEVERTSSVSKILISWLTTSRRVE